MKVLIWSPYGFRDSYWGPGLSASKLYSLRGDEISQLDVVVGTKSNSSNIPEYVDSIISFGILKRSKLSQLLFLIKSFFWIRRYGNNYDVCHVLGAYEISTRPGIWLKKTGCLTVLKLINSGSGFTKGSLMSKLLNLHVKRKKLLVKFDRILAISQTIKKELLSYGIPESKISFIPNGVDCSFFLPLEDEEEKIKFKEKLGIKTPKIILCTGEINHRKGQLILLEALAHEDFKSRFSKEITIMLIGPASSETKKFINSYSEEHGLNIIYIDFTLDIKKYYQVSDLFVLLSNNEGLSNALLEAMASGLHILTTPISGSIDWIVNSINGFLVERRDYNQIRQSIIFFLENKHLGIGLEARRTVLKNLDLPIIYRSHIDLFYKLVNEKK